MGEVLPKDQADEWTAAEEFSGRKAFDAWRFARLDRIVPWDWADMGCFEKRLWIERANEGRAA